MRFRPFILPTIILLIVNAGFFDSAEAKTVEAGEGTASWNGKGIIEDVGEGERIFRGSITGTMFIRHPDGTAHTRIHAAKIDCQAIVRLSGSGEERQAALCIMSAHEGKDLAYGEMRCVGKKDECKGDFTFSWGSGEFKGISGTTPFVGGINIEQKEEGRIYGYAAWPGMTYSLP